MAPNAGVPVVTLAGAKAHASRVAASVVLALHLPELVARTPQDYQDLAVLLAARPRALAAVRERLLGARSQRRLFDRRWWVLHLERSLHMMRELWLSAQPPMHLIVADSDSSSS